MRLRHLLIFAALLAPFFLRDYTVTNELKYISIAEEALDNGTWFSFYNHGAAYADKPPLYLWIVMSSKLIFGSYNMWFIGLASVLPLIGIMIVMGRWITSCRPDFRPAAADAMLATTGMFLGSALVLRMDMLMTFFIVLSLYTFWRLYSGTARPRHRWLLPLWIFMALFTKGPVGIMAPILSIAVFLAVKGEIRTFGRYLGWRQWALLLGLCAVWFSLVYIEGGSEYIGNLLFHQTVGRGINSFHHARPWWYYIAHIPTSFAPWVLLFAGVLAAGAIKRLARSDMERFFVCIILSTFVMLSMFSSKLDIYLIPIYPFVVYLTVLWLDRFGGSVWTKIAAAFPAAVFVLVLPAVAIADATGRIPIEYDSLTVVYIALGGLFAASAVAIWMICRGRVRESILWSAGGLLAMIAVASTDLRQFNPYFGVGTLAERGEQLAERAGTDRFAYYRFRGGENMDAYLGRSPERIENLQQLDSMECLPVRTVLFTGWKEPKRDAAFAEWLSLHEVIEEGQYGVTVIGGKNE